MSPYPWKWKTSIRAGGNGQEDHQSTTANSLEKITWSSACHNETAALVITDGSYLMAMISFLVRKKKSPFTIGKTEGGSCSVLLKGLPSKPWNHHVVLSQVITTVNWKPYLQWDRDTLFCPFPLHLPQCYHCLLLRCPWQQLHIMEPLRAASAQISQPGTGPSLGERQSGIHVPCPGP